MPVNPKGVVARRQENRLPATPSGHNPVGVEAPPSALPRVVPAVQPWALLHNRFAVGAAHATLGWNSRELLGSLAPILVGGAEDHVHILARFGRTITQATWVKELKRVSNEWVQRQGREFSRFHWQEGYSDFSVSHSNLDRVQSYIARQDQHHGKRGFQEELRALLCRHQIPYDEKHLWD